MSAQLDDLLEKIRSHPALPELLEQVSMPSLPRLKYSTLEEAGSMERFANKTLYVSGARDQSRRWIWMLTGSCPVEAPHE